MITEDYVSFETAKLLKEKGFDWDCKHVYDLVRPQSCADGKIYDNFPDKNPNAYVELVSAPTLQMAMKWLRNNFNLNPVPYALSLGWAFDVFDLSGRDITGCKKLYSMDFPTKSTCYETYEEAAEAAIKYCLENLI